MRPWLERLVNPNEVIARRVHQSLVDPATRFFSKIELFWPPVAAIVVATLLQASLPTTFDELRWIFVGLSILLLVVLGFVNPGKLEQRHVPIRVLMLMLVAALSIGNTIAGARLVIDLVNGKGITDAGTLLRTGGAIWLTNVIVFSLWYWLFDRGSPSTACSARRSVPGVHVPADGRHELHASGLAAPSTSTTSTWRSPMRWRSARPT